MITPRLLALSALTLALSAAGCSNSDSDNSASADKAGREDVVSVSELLVLDDTGTGALKIGDGAELLAEAQQASKQAVERIRSAAHHLEEMAASKEPDRTGTTLGQPWSVWTASKDGADYRLFVLRIKDTRVRYYLSGKKSADADYKPLLTGVFLKKEARRGGGRIHINLTNVSDVEGGPNADGQMQVWFANFRNDTVARRVLYRKLVSRSDPEKNAYNYGSDYLRHPGVGGRFRALAVGDLAPAIPGNEGLALRAVWRTGEGGRADGLLIGLGQVPKVLGHFSECWDKGGLRTAFKNIDGPENPDNPSEGDVSSCAGIAQDTVPDSLGRLENTDVDPDVDAELTESGAASIDEKDADLAVDPDKG